MIIISSYYEILFPLRTTNAHYINYLILKLRPGYFYM